MSRGHPWKGHKPGTSAEGEVGLSTPTNGTLTRTPRARAKPRNTSDLSRRSNVSKALRLSPSSENGRRKQSEGGDGRERRDGPTIGTTLPKSSRTRRESGRRHRDPPTTHASCCAKLKARAHEMHPRVKNTWSRRSCYCATRGSPRDPVCAESRSLSAFETPPPFAPAPYTSTAAKPDVGAASSAREPGRDFSFRAHSGAEAPAQPKSGEVWTPRRSSPKGGGGACCGAAPPEASGRCGMPCADLPGDTPEHH